MSRRVLLASLLHILAAISLAGQDHPNHAVGFPAAQSFDSGGIDDINLFNGNLNLAVPIGSSGLTLTWSGNTWTYHTRTVYCDPDDGPTCKPRTYNHARPKGGTNAGFGWRLSLGELSQRSVSMPRTYVSPDGAEHAFFPTLHETETVDPNVWYTRDGTYLRSKLLTAQQTNDTYQIEFPDGSSQQFDTAQGRLRQVRDRFGNVVDVAYGTGGDGAPIWTLTDSHARVSTVTFKRLANPSPTLEDSTAYDVVKSIATPAFNGTTATYTFHYGNDATSDEVTKISRMHVSSLDPAVSQTVWVPLLTSIDLPDGTKWQFRKVDGSLGYDIGDASTMSNPASSSFSGNLIAVTLPTLGGIEWDWQMYKYPVHSANGTVIPDAFTRSVGVKERRMVAKDSTVEGRSVYNTRSSPSFATMINSVSQMSGDDTVSRAVRFFSLCESCGAGSYGLPVTFETNPEGAGTPEIPTFDAQGRYLSVKFYDGDSKLLRSTYLRHQMESGFNRRVVSEKTIFHDDEGRWVSVAHSDFDGLGHYRTSTHEGDVDSGSGRVVTTAYNSKNAAVDPNGRDVGTWAAVNSTFQMLGKEDPWVLGTYSSRTVTENGVSLRSLQCFDLATGFLKRERVLAGAVPGVNDFVSRFTANARGEVTREEYFGGDLAPVPTDALCASQLGTATYRLDHTYASGSRSSSTYWNYSTGAAMPYKHVDRTIDASGLVKSSRDTAGVETTYAYDSSGRVTSISSPGTAAMTFTYTNASAASAASVEMTRSSSAAGTLRSKVAVDSLARVSREETDMPGGKQHVRLTTYNSHGLPATVTSQIASNSAITTTFADYDPFGRAGRIVSSNGQATTLSYSGVRTITRSVQIGTAFTPPSTVQASWSVTNETYDRYGRLLQVVAPGSTGTATYTYDVGNRLVKALVTADGTTQQRLFTYDGRGMLTQEQHPETGTVKYSGHDARGLSTRKRGALRPSSTSTRRTTASGALCLSVREIPTT